MGINELAHGRFNAAFHQSCCYEVFLPALIGVSLPMLQLAPTAFFEIFAEGRDAFGRCPDDVASGRIDCLTRQNIAKCLAFTHAFTAPVQMFNDDVHAG
jgi:hypothetical protein